MLSNNEIERYSRQIPIIGVEGQEKLRRSTVLIVGVGGLGSVASFYLVAAGIGKLILVDEGLIELSNLQRQILYTVDDIGKPKVIVARERLKKLNPDTEIIAVQEKFDDALADELIPQADVVIDALDNWETRIILDRAAWRHSKPYVHAGVHGFYGQLTVLVPGKTPCLRCIFPRKPPVESPIPVFATTPGVLGVLEANEVLKLLTGHGEPLINKLLIYDGSSNLFEIIEIDIPPTCNACTD